MTQHFWHAVEFAANTLIFLLAGLIIGDFIHHSATPRDWGTMFSLCVHARFARAVFRVVRLALPLFFLH